MSRAKVVLALLAVLLATGCRSQKAAPNVLAKVGDRIITANDFRRKLLEYGSGRGSQPLEETVREQILNDLIERQLLLNEAEVRNILVTPSELEAELQRLTENYPGKEFEKMLATRHLSAGEWRDEVGKTLLLKKMFNRITDAPVEIPDSKVTEYYDAHKDQYKVPEQVKALQILVDSEQDAFDILAQLRKGTPFETVARERSLGPEAQSGGDLGYFARGTMPEIFDEAIFSLELGKISRVVSSEYGYHLFKLADRRPEHLRTLDECRAEIRAKLNDDERQKLYAKWLEARLKKTKILKNRALLARLGS